MKLQNNKSEEFKWIYHSPHEIGLIFLHIITNILVICEISGSRGGEYEDDCLLGFCAV
jgi:hypothetical protein